MERFGKNRNDAENDVGNDAEMMLDMEDQGSG